MGGEAADAIDEFLALALTHEGAHPPSLESFLDWFEKGAGDVKRDMEQAGGAVRVMTVHGAKGLEANVVILPDTAQIPDHERRGPLLYTDDCVYFGVAKAFEPPPVTAAKSSAQDREMREYRRLLYVAATRAREFLVVCGYETRNGTKTNSWYPHLEAAARRIGHEETIAGETVIAVGAALGGMSAPAERVLAFPPAVTEVLAPAPPRPSRQHACSARRKPRREEPSLLVPVRRFRDAIPARTFSYTRCSRAYPSFRQANAKRRGDPISNGRVLPTRTSPPDRRNIGHPRRRRFRPALRAQQPRRSGAHRRSARAWPRASESAASTARSTGSAVTEDAVLIADFKTNRPPPASPEETPRIYRTQMALYRAALQKIYPGKRIDCASIWTDGARLMPLPPTLLDAEIAAIAAVETANICRSRRTLTPKDGVPTFILVRTDSRITWRPSKSPIKAFSPTCSIPRRRSWWISGRNGADRAA
jgi:ATP-dependent helicase/nuclease subunit A